MVALEEKYVLGFVGHRAPKVPAGLGRCICGKRRCGRFTGWGGSVIFEEGTVYLSPCYGESKISVEMSSLTYLVAVRNKDGKSRLCRI